MLMMIYACASFSLIIDKQCISQTFVIYVLRSAIRQTKEFVLSIG